MTEEEKLAIAIKTLQMIGETGNQGIGWSHYTRNGRFLTDGELAREALALIRDTKPKKGDS